MRRCRSAWPWLDNTGNTEPDCVPPVIGDKAGDGIPQTLTQKQSAANLKIQQQDLAQVKSVADANHVSVDKVQAHPENYGLTATDVTRYHNAAEVQKAVDRYRNDANTPGTTKHPPIFLTKYGPEAFGGKGAAAIAIGNPDTSNTVAACTSEFTAGGCPCLSRADELG
ncbi:hypothetical protein [Mycobacterium sp. DL440]|uniref:hypothetical protein n=1 Tax=Mycobacterium sp. DL440 TaxID=2675523 RepID=UPI00141DE0CD|nr:hypothetical protein [Mycobacterium sp. DL440]